MRHLITTLLLCFCATGWCDQVILAPDIFLHDAFGKPPPAKFLWLDDQAQKSLNPIFGHRYPQARLRYWRADGKTAWILEDIGKEFPITAGFIVSKGVIDKARVLTYRESRGAEIQLPAFLRQFEGQHLKEGQLSEEVDSISGATLSVWAMQRMAKAALTVDALAP
jgi:hypothetical protein